MKKPLIILKKYIFFILFLFVPLIILIVIDKRFDGDVLGKLVVIHYDNFELLFMFLALWFLGFPFFGFPIYPLCFLFAFNLAAYKERIKWGLTNNNFSYFSISLCILFNAVFLSFIFNIFEFRTSIFFTQLSDKEVKSIFSESVVIRNKFDADEMFGKDLKEQFNRFKTDFKNISSIKYFSLPSQK